ncbi:MAG: hypothetical protein SAJ12_10475 [Jaaginema sp. PMC 1079.18]|nr:hypothetical protein [Jaaginema sp. PMC 1079.18]
MQAFGAAAVDILNRIEVRGGLTGQAYLVPRLGVSVDGLARDG